MKKLKIRQMPLDSFASGIIAAILFVAVGLWILNADLNPNSPRYSYRKAMRYPIGIASVVVGVFALGSAAYMLVAGKLTTTVIEVTDTHVHHYPFQVSIPHQAIVAIEVPRKGEDSDVRLITIYWLAPGDSIPRRHFLDFRLFLRTNNSFQRVLATIEERTEGNTTEIQGKYFYPKLSPIYRARLF